MQPHVKIHGGITLLGKNSEVANLTLDIEPNDPTILNIGKVWFNSAEQRVSYTEVFDTLDQPVIRDVAHLGDIAILTTLIQNEINARIAALNNLTINNVSEIRAFEVVTTSTTANQPLVEVPATIYRSVEFNIQAVNQTEQCFHSITVKAIHNGTTVNSVEYADVSLDSGPCASFSTEITDGKLRLLVTPVSANTTDFKITALLIKI